MNPAGFSFHPSSLIPSSFTDEGATAVRTPAVGEAVLHLAWLPPRAGSLAALARLAPPEAWAATRSDPGAVLLVVREAAAGRALPSFFPTLLHDPAVLEGALRQLDIADPSRPPVTASEQDHPALRPIYHAAVAGARLAGLAAERTGRCDPDNAWAAGLLAPLGWLAVAAAAPAEAARCLDDPAHAARPAATEQAHWGHDQAGLARRLARRWRLPAWLAAVVGHLGLPLATAQKLGADPGLFLTAQLAVSLAQQHGSRLRLPVAVTPAEAAVALGLPDAELARLAAAAAESPVECQPGVTGDLPLPLLRDLLRLAAENRRLRDAPALRDLEAAVDELHRALEEARAGEAERLRAQKLSALAEFAAGAGHEINNPLAVISGQAQYLLQHEEEESRRRALQTIIGQSQRIHHTLRDLMLFARPPRQQRQVLDLRALVQEVITALGDLAGPRRVQLRRPEPAAAPPVFVEGDPGQLRTVVSCLLRNAVEAAPADGWAGARLELPDGERVEVVVEDSGPGVAPAQQEHLFDPFYSGRQAGRGRGLGLPIAWRLAREHGGSVRLVPAAGVPTRFVLTLPRHEPVQYPLSA
jgi:signal transduction histidine kinase